MMESFTFLSEARDRRAGGKTYLTQQNAPRLCEALAHTREYREQLGTEHIEAMSRLAPLYDIGKAGIPDGVLVKSGKLSPAEFSMIKKHTSYGEEVIDRARERAGVKEDNLLQLARDIVASHHERWDGLGYPLGIGGQDIPLSGRIIAIVDVY
jgi:HD-GYP domain-containing protein (c-di-GMP phosphodiesterase class II)